jgi:hypothetical protein
MRPSTKIRRRARFVESSGLQTSGVDQQKIHKFGTAKSTTYDPCGENPSEPPPVFNELATVPQAVKTPVVRILVNFGVTRRKVHPRQNLTDEALPAQDASVGEESELAGLRVVGHAPPWKFLVLAVGNPPTLHKLGPIRNVVALMDCVVAVTSRLTERR